MTVYQLISNDFNVGQYVLSGSLKFSSSFVRTLTQSEDGHTIIDLVRSGKRSVSCDVKVPESEYAAFAEVVYAPVQVLQFVDPESGLPVEVSCYPAESIEPVLVSGARFYEVSLSWMEF